MPNPTQTPTQTHTQTPNMESPLPPWQTLYRYWFANPQVWFTPSKHEDEHIVSTWLRSVFSVASGSPVFRTKEELVGTIIMLDQVPRHAVRVGKVSDGVVKKLTCVAYERSLCALEGDVDLILDMSMEELVFVLMPFRHYGRARGTPEIILEAINIVYTMSRVHASSGALVKRFMKAAYSDLLQAKTKRDVSSPHATNPLWHSSAHMARHVQKEFYRVLGFPSAMNPICISLSGGVDSVVMTAICACLGYHIVAVHVNYKNRGSDSDYEQAVAEKVAAMYGIPIVVRCFDELRRQDTSHAHIDREAYEDITRRARFHLYSCAAKGLPVLLGHHKDDALENIVTNMVRVKDLHNLEGMTGESWHHGVRVLRPMLSMHKREIQALADEWKLPYVRDNTREDCQRGKLRNQLIPHMKEFHPNMTKSLHRVSKQVAELYAMMEDTCHDIVTRPKKTSTSDDAVMIVVFRSNVVVYRGAVSPRLPHMAWRVILLKMKVFDVSDKSIDNMIQKMRDSKRCRQHSLNKDTLVTWTPHPPQNHS